MSLLNEFKPFREVSVPARERNRLDQGLSPIAVYKKPQHLVDGLLKLQSIIAAVKLEGKNLLEIIGCEELLRVSVVISSGRVSVEIGC